MKPLAANILNQTDYSGNKQTGKSQSRNLREITKQKHKQAHAFKLARQRDFLGMGETHSTVGRVEAAKIPPELRHFWSHGDSSTAGIGLLISKSFLHPWEIQELN